jgi:hypothetical protein
MAAWLRAPAPALPRRNRPWRHLNRWRQVSGFSPWRQVLRKYGLELSQISAMARLSPPPPKPKIHSIKARKGSRNKRLPFSISVRPFTTFAGYKPLWFKNLVFTTASRQVEPAFWLCGMVLYHNSRRRRWHRPQATRRHEHCSLLGPDPSAASTGHLCLFLRPGSSSKFRFRARYVRFGPIWSVWGGPYDLCSRNNNWYRMSKEIETVIFGKNVRLYTGKN